MYTVLFLSSIKKLQWDPDSAPQQTLRRQISAFHSCSVSIQQQNSTWKQWRHHIRLIEGTMSECKHVIFCHSELVINVEPVTEIRFIWQTSAQIIPGWKLEDTHSLTVKHFITVSCVLILWVNKDLKKKKSWQISSHKPESHSHWDKIRVGLPL